MAEDRLIDGREVHELAAIFPKMTAGEYQTLKAHIQEHGLIDDIILLDGKILDGRHRAAACEQLGIDRRYTVLSPDMNPVEFVAAKNFHRRSLNENQKALAARKLMNYRRENNFTRPPKSQFATLGGSALDATVIGLTAAQISQISGVSEATLDRVGVIEKKAAPEVLEAFTNADLSTGAAEQIAKLDKETQREVLKDIVDGKPIGQTIAAAKEKSPKEFKKFGQSSVAPKPRPTPKVNLRELKNQWEAAYRAVNLAWERTQNGEGVPAEWQNVANSLNSIIDIIDKAGEFVFAKADCVEEEPLDDYADEPDLDDLDAELYRDGLDFGDEPRPNPYEYED